MSAKKKNLEPRAISQVQAFACVATHGSAEFGFERADRGVLDGRRQWILSGEIASKLTSPSELTDEPHLALAKVRRAIDVLARERLVQRVPGRGTFVINSDSIGTHDSD